MHSINIQLRHKDLFSLHPFPDLVLIFRAHEHISLLILDEEVPQDLFDENTLLVRGADYAHRGRV